MLFFLESVMQRRESKYRKLQLSADTTLFLIFTVLSLVLGWDSLYWPRFRGFSQNFQANVGIMPQIRWMPLPLTRFISLFTSLFLDPNYNHESIRNFVWFLLSLTIQNLRSHNELEFMSHPPPWIFYCQTVPVTDEMKLNTSILFLMLYFIELLSLRNAKFEWCEIHTRGWSKHWKGTWHF